MLEQLKMIFGDSIPLKNHGFVDVEKFSNLFSEVEQISYEELIRVNNKNDYAYSQYIEDWREKGLIE